MAAAPRRCLVRAGRRRLFDGLAKFPTADGRARFVATPYRPLAEPSERAMAVRAEYRPGARPVAHDDADRPRAASDGPSAANRCSIFTRPMRSGLRPGDGDLARVESRHGATVLPVRLSTEQRPARYSHRCIGPTVYLRRSDRPARRRGHRSDIGTAELKATPVRVTPLATFWRGSLLRRTEAPMAEGPYYWARIPLDNGQAFELAGWEPLPGRQQYVK